MMPSVSEQQKKLNELFSGTWRGEEKLYPSDWDPKGGPAFGTWIVRAAIDGFAVLVDYDEERDGKVVYRGHGIHTWDAKQSTFFCYWFDNIGIAPAQAIRATLDGNRYSYQSEEPGGHMRMTYEFAADKLEFRIEKSPDGKTWNPMHEGRYTRVR
jgi:hypothetical protein